MSAGVVKPDRRERASYLQRLLRECFLMEKAWAGQAMPAHIGEVHDRLAREAQALQDQLDEELEPWQGE